MTTVADAGFAIAIAIAPSNRMALPKTTRSYVGRFAPSPTGPLHLGSLVAALASWLDARAHGGRWLVRIEDIDGPRCPPGMGDVILAQLAALGLVPDLAPVWQSSRESSYEAALARLVDGGHAYPCGCSRAEIEHALSAMGRPHEADTELVYPGTCRHGLHGKIARAVRLRLDGGDGWVDDHDENNNSGDRPLETGWHDRRLGDRHQQVGTAVGDFVLRRADGAWAYQLAVVVDDAAQGVTDIVRGEDLADNTPRQIRLQQLLGLPTPRYLHTPLVMAACGRKLSKQHGAAPVPTDRPIESLAAAGRILGLSVASANGTGEPASWLRDATALWADRWRGS